jgi:hypothetical protein
MGSARFERATSCSGGGGNSAHQRVSAPAINLSPPMPTDGAGLRRPASAPFYGTDGEATGSPAFSLHDELALWVQAGLTPLEALRTATLNPATFLNATDSLGTMEEGKLADLVLLDADPIRTFATPSESMQWWRTDATSTEARWTRCSPKRRGPQLHAEGAPSSGSVRSPPCRCRRLRALGSFSSRHHLIRPAGWLRY